MPTVPSSSNRHSNEATLIVRGRRIVMPEGERAASIHVRDGIITGIRDFDDAPAGVPVHDAGDLAVMPGLVDTHVHINEPGRTEWEGFEAATRAASAGGVTTLIEMPLNSIPATTSVAAYREKLAATEGQLHVDTGFWGGVVPGNASELRPLWEAGVFGFKCFLAPSGVAEFSHVRDRDLRKALPELARLRAPLLVHAESAQVLANTAEVIDRPGVPDRDKIFLPANKYGTWLAYRPRSAENEAIEYLIGLAREFRVPIHIVHLSSSEAVPLLRAARSSGSSVTVETCPHYLTFVAEEIPEGATQFKCAPPIRVELNREALWEALRDATIDLIASDHSPCPLEMKLLEQGNFVRAWGGIASLQIGLPAVWTQARKRGYALTDIVRWMCSGPARLARISSKKGSIVPGCDADFVILDPDAEFRVEPEKLFHQHKVTPYAGRTLTGIVETTFLRGQIIFDRGEVTDTPQGRVLRRGAL
jgi:allantoinase